VSVDDQRGDDGRGAAAQAPGTSDASAALLALRARFDDVDARIVALLAERAALSRAAGAIKRAHALPVVDEQREDHAAAARAALARAHGLDEAFVGDVFAVVVRHSRRVQGAG
jgi:chorismate mutase